MPPSQKKLIEAACQYSSWAWARLNNLQLIGGKPFSLADHPYQKVLMEREVYDKSFNLVRRKTKVCHKWAAQMTKTTGTIINEVHHLVYGMYPQGAMFIFPTSGLVERFSKSRFTPLIEENQFLQRYIRSTDTIELKRVGRSNLYFVGGKVLQKIAGEQKTSAALKSEPVDSLNFDELDEIDPDIVVLAHDRIGHSEVKYESYTGTPSIPDYGIDKLYAESDQCVWMIKCRHCGTETCLELEFPDIIRQDHAGRWFRACKKCGQEVFTVDGRWVPQFPGREMEGTWISKLNLADKYNNLGDLIKRYENPPNGKKGLVMNGDLGMAYIEAENRLTKPDLLAILGTNPMPMRHEGPTAMGLDCGSDFHGVIFDRPYERATRLVKAFHATSNGLKDWHVIHDLITQYNVKCLVIDQQWEPTKVKNFIAAEGGFNGCEMYGNIYQNNVRGVVNWDSKEHIVREDRTEICDNTHDIVITPGRLLLPRNSETLEAYMQHMCNLAKVYTTDEQTGSREARYRKLGPDHFRHATNYALLASKRIGVYTPKEVQERRKDKWDDTEEKKSTGYMGA